MVEDAEVHRVWEEGVQGEHLLLSLVPQPGHLELLSKEAQDHQVPNLQEHQVAHPPPPPPLQVSLVLSLVLEDHRHQEVKDRLHLEVKGHLEQVVLDHLDIQVVLDHLGNLVVQDPWHLSKDNPQEVLPELFHLDLEVQDRQYLLVR